MKTAKKSVKKIVSHDRLTVAATYPTGGSFRFTVGRGGERLTWGGSADRAEAGREMKTFMRFAAFLPGETNGARIDRIASKAEAVGGIAELVASLGTSVAIVA